jgi:hypothetical protein
LQEQPNNPEAQALLPAAERRLSNTSTRRVTLSPRSVPHLVISAAELTNAAVRSAGRFRVVANQRLVGHSIDPFNLSLSRSGLPAMIKKLLERRVIRFE